MFPTGTGARPPATGGRAAEHSAPSLTAAGPARWRPAVLAFVVTVAAVVVGVAVTREGIGVSRDSAVYLGTAESVLDGDGLTVPFRSYPVAPTADPLAVEQRLENFPPLYPLLLAGVSRLTGTDVRTSARVVNVAVLVILALLAGGVLYAFTGGGLLLPGVVVLMLLASVDVLVGASMAWTELLFTLLALGALVMLAWHVDRPGPAKLAACAALVALAFLTRFAGAALLLGAVGSVLLLSRCSSRRRFGEAATLAVAGALPVLVWAAASGSGGRLANRRVAFHPVGAGSISRGSRTMLSWLLPGSPRHDGFFGELVGAAIDLPYLVRLALALAAVAVFVVVARRSGPALPAPPALGALPMVLLVFLGAYLAFLVVSVSLLDASAGRFDHRILMPAHVVALVAATLLVRQRVDLHRYWKPALVVTTPFVLLLVGHAVVTVVDGRQFAGLYAGERWERRPIMEAVRSLPPTRPVVTNEPNAVWAVTGRSTAPVPERKSVATLRPNEDLDSQLVALGRAMRARGAFLVYVRDGGDSAFAADEATLRARLPLQLVRRETDGDVYQISCPGTPGTPEARPGLEDGDHATIGRVVC